MKRLHPQLRFHHALILLMHTLVLRPSHVQALDPQHIPITVPPSADHLRHNPESAPIKRRIHQHNIDLQQGKEYAYIAVFKAETHVSHNTKLVVRIDKNVIADVLIHNSTTLSFRIPNNIVLNENKFSSSWLEIQIGSDNHRRIPLIVLDNAIIKVDLKDYRGKVKRQREGNLRDVDVSVASSPQPLRTSSKSHADSQPSQKQDSQTSDTLSNHVQEPSSHTEKDDDLSHQEKKPSATMADDQFNTESAESLLSEAERLLEDGTLSSSSAAAELLKKACQLGSVQAMTIISCLLLSGTTPGIKQDVEQAVNYLVAAGDKGYPDAQAMLGFLYASGVASPVIEKDTGAAILMWSFAAEGGSLHAKMALGFRYHTGTDVQEDCEKAAEYYQKVAEDILRTLQNSAQVSSNINRDDNEYRAEVQTPASYHMQYVDKRRLREHMRKRVFGEANDYIQYQRNAANRGDPGAQVIMGNLYYYGDADMPPNIERARQFFGLAAAAGRAEAHAHLGLMDLRVGNNASAQRHLSVAASHGDKFGLNGMGFLFLHGVGVPRDEQQAAKYFLRAAELELPEAMFNVAVLYSRGVGVDESSNEAFRWFQAAAKLGHMRSNYQIGLMMMHGIAPASKHCSWATQYFRFVAEQGVWNKILPEALRAYERGAYADSLYRYLQAAHVGIELAQFNAAFMYEQNTLSNKKGMYAKYLESQEIDRDRKVMSRASVVEEALELYQMSASQGNPESMVRIGDLAFEECKDYSRAAASYEKAAKQRNAEAMFNLGWMHARGFGMNADQHMAKRYFDQAKEVDADAVIPATIAVYSLAYSESVYSFVDTCTALVERMYSSRTGGRASLGGGIEHFTMHVMFSLEGVALSILLGILMLVINARQRRLMAAEVADEGAERGDGEEDREGHARM